MQVIKLIKPVFDVVNIQFFWPKSDTGENQKVICISPSFSYIGEIYSFNGIICSITKVVFYKSSLWSHKRKSTFEYSQAKLLHLYICYYFLKCE